MDSEILKAFRGEATNRLPVWLMRQAGRYLPEYRELRGQAGSFLDLCFNPKMAAEVTLQPLRRFDLDAAIVFSDILVLPHALGQSLRFAEGEGPLLEAISDVSALRDAADENILNPVYETLSLVRANLPKDKALIGFAGSPWTVASYMIEGKGGHDFSTIKALMVNDTLAFERIIEHLVQHTILHLSAQIKAGADAVQLFESWASALHGEAFERYVIAPNKRIIEGLRALHPNVPIVFFARACGEEGLMASLSVGADVLGLSQDVNLDFAAQNLQDKVCLQGNLAPEILLKGGLEMQDGVESICAKLGHKPFVFNLGHGVIKETPPDHVGALVDAVHAFKR